MLFKLDLKHHQDFNMNSDDRQMMTDDYQLLKEHLSFKCGV